MIEKELCEYIINTYYDDIYHYCFAQLHNIHAAEDCAQEVFLIFFSKRTKLYFSEKIHTWLYSAAKKVVLAYKRKNAVVFENIDDLSETISDNTDENSQQYSSEIFDKLSDEDLEILKIYMDYNHEERKALAEQRGMTLSALYSKVYRIKKSLRKDYESKV